MDQLERNRAASRRYHRNKHQFDPEWTRARNVKSKYGLTLADYDELVSGPCEVCGTVDKTRVCDHDHETGAVRSALCFRCNSQVDWYLKHREALERWREIVFGRIWVNRIEWARVIQGHAQLAAIENAQKDMIEHLEMQITELKMAIDAEKKRADRAVDRILQLAGSAPISPSPVMPSMQDLDGIFNEDPKVVKELRTAIKEKGAEVVLLEDTPEDS